MKHVSFHWFGLFAVVAAGLCCAAAPADWSEDFSGPLTNWDTYTYNPFADYGASSISMGVVDGKLVFDAHLPYPEYPPADYNMAAGYSAVILNDPAFPDAEDLEITCVLELGGTSDQLYAGILARAQDLEFTPGQIIVGGLAYGYLLSGYDQGEVGLYKVHDYTDDSLVIIELEDIDPAYNSRIDNEPVYLKMKVTTNDLGNPHIEAMMSFSADFSNPFGIIDYVDEGAKGPMITGAGKVGLIGFNDVDELAMPASASFDNLVIITEFGINPGDANGDGSVNSADLDIVRANWGSTVPTGAADQGDLSGDGVVNSADLDIVRGNWGTTYAAAVPEPGFCIFAGLALLFAGLRLQKR